MYAVRDDSCQKMFTCMAPVKHNGDNISEGSTIDSVFLAGRGFLQNLDLGMDAMTDIKVVEEPITCMRMTRSLMCGTANGDVIAYDPRSNTVTSTLKKAHMTGVSTIEVRGDQLASFGFNSAFVSPLFNVKYLIITYNALTEWNRSLTSMT